jgi:putative transport protein
MIDVATTLREHPELALFLTLAVGFVLGRLGIGSFRLGNVVGTLLAGIMIGQLGLHVPPIVQVIAFNIFLFATGYKVGPQFIRSLGTGALPQVALTIVFCVTALVTVFVAVKIFDYDAGTAAGLLAGAVTESATIGTATNTISGLGLSEAETRRLLDNIPVAFAVTYLVGTLGTVFFLSILAPRLFGVDLKAASRELEQKLSIAPEAGGASAYREWDFRAYRLAEAWAGRSVGDLERSFDPDRVFVERVRRGGELLDAEPATVLAAGDAIALAARRRVVAAGPTVGTEIEDRQLLDFPVDAVDVVVTSKALDGRTIASLGEELGRGVALRELVRGGEKVPLAPGTTVNRGDLLRIAGAVHDIERAGRALGYIVPSTIATDVVFVGLGMVLGGFLGLLTVEVGGLPLSLTTSGGTLIMGLVFGWLRSVRPTFGSIPEPALWIFDTLGLAVFIAVLGLNAGPGFVEGLQRTGLALLLITLIAAITAHLAALLLGRFVLRMNPVILFGACAGAGTSTASLRAIQDAAQSKVPVLGYTIPFAIGEILLTAWGVIIVLLTQ